MPKTTITIRIDEDDKNLIQSYAKMHGKSTAEVLRDSALERIEDEFDIAELRAAMKSSDNTFMPHEEVMKKYGLR